MNYLVDLIIKPSRNNYSIDELGDTLFTFNKVEYKRIDYTITNIHKNKIQASFWSLNNLSSTEVSYTPCIIYCHGNGGNRLDVMEIFEFLNFDFNLLSFDFTGAGLSEGEYVTLGFNEVEDLKAVVNFIRNELHVYNIVLYGRSMGAVTCLRYAEYDRNIKAVILDSPFSDFTLLCKEILYSKFYIPDLIADYLIKLARDKIKTKVNNFDIYNFTPLNEAKNIRVPTLIMHGKYDSLVKIEHSVNIFNYIPSTTYKKYYPIEGEHNDCREGEIVNIIKDFISQFVNDQSIIKDNKRRLFLKNLNIEYVNKKQININDVFSNYKRDYKNKNKEKKNHFNNFSNLLNLNKQNNDKYINFVYKRSKSSENSINNKEFKTNNNKRNNSYINNKRYNKDNILNEVVTTTTKDNNKIEIDNIKTNYNNASTKDNSILNSNTKINNPLKIRSVRNNTISNLVSFNYNIKSASLNITQIDTSTFTNNLNDSYVNANDITSTSFNI